MLLPMLYTGRVRGIPTAKIVLCCAWFTLGGVLGVKLMNFIESGNWNGRSFFGALFIAPPFALVIAKLLKLPFGSVSDMCPAAISAILALLKLKCYQDGCCYGKVLYSNELGQAVRFPSQLVELGAALVLMVIFLFIARSGRMKGCLYGLYMVAYGAVRFYLNTLRETTPFLLGMAAGNFWAVVSAMLGTIWIAAWLVRNRRTVKTRQRSEAKDRRDSGGAMA